MSTPLRGSQAHGNGHQLGGGVAAEVEVLRVHVAHDLIADNHYIDPQKWSPLIYNFRTTIASPTRSSAGPSAPSAETKVIESQGNLLFPFPPTRTSGII